MFGRAVRLRCLLCGQGRLFASFWRLNPSCSACGLEFNRERGYFAGGMELHWLLSFVIPIVGYTIFRTSIPQIWLWMLFAAAFALGFYRHSRSFWMCIDYWIDPVDRELPHVEDFIGCSRDDCPCEECVRRRQLVG